MPLKFILKTIKLTEKDSKKKNKWEKDLRGVPGQDYVRQIFPTSKFSLESLPAANDLNHL